MWTLNPAWDRATHRFLEPDFTEINIGGMKTLREAMTRFVYGWGDGWGQFTVRIWTEIPMYDPVDFHRLDNTFDHKEQADKMCRLIDGLSAPRNALQIAEALLQSDHRVNAVEVTDENGAGSVIYRDWP